MVQVNGKHSPSPVSRRPDPVPSVVRSRSDEYRLQAVILGERLGKQAFQQGYSGWERIIRSGVAV